MRIAQIAPLWERVPPTTYGGTELIASLLTDELVRRSHEVTLFASGDSITLATLESVHSCALRNDQSIREYGMYEMLQLAQIYERADEFDIIHSHVGCATLPYVDLVRTPTVHTLHGIFTPDNEKLFSWAKTQPFVSISNAQRDHRLGLNYVATVYNGVDTDSYKFYPTPQTPPYLAFLGRFSPEKGTHHAIEIAKRVGLPLKMAGKIDAVDVDYFEHDIRPHIDGEQIQYLGEANHAQKNVLMGNAIATLFPITWREPFGLVMIESMASGTPVIAMPLGSTPEVIAHGKTGFLGDTVDDCVAAVSQIETLSRYDCRDRATQCFGIKQMVDGYEAVYAQILGERFAETNHLQLVRTV